MAKFLEAQIKSLTGAVVSEEVPRAQRKAPAKAPVRTKSKTRTKAGSRAKAKR